MAVEEHEVMSFIPTSDDKKKPSLALLLPMGPNVDSRFFKNFLYFFFDLANDYKVEFIFTEMMPLDIARNYLMKLALDRKCDYHLWLDSDILAPLGCMKRIRSHNKDIVSGLYFSKTTPSFPVIRHWSEKNQTFYHWNEPIKFNDLIEIGGMGFGFVFMTRKAAQDIWDISKGRPFEFIFKHWTPDGVEMTSEDLVFSKYAIDAGYKIYCDTSIVVGHSGNVADEKLFLYQNIMKSVTYNDDLMLKHLMEYFGLSHEVVIDNLSKGPQLVANDWNAKNPKTPQEIEQFYKDEVNYIWDLAAWHITTRKNFDISLVSELKLTDTKTILDYGCGIGQNGLMLAMEGFEVTLADYRCASLEFAMFRAKKLGLKNVKFKIICEDTFDEKYDTIICFDVIEHLPNFDAIKDFVKFIKSKATQRIITTYTLDNETHPMHIGFDKEINDYLQKELKGNNEIIIDLISEENQRIGDKNVKPIV